MPSTNQNAYDASTLVFDIELSNEKIDVIPRIYA